MNNIGIRKAYGQNRSYVLRNYKTFLVQIDREYLSFDRFEPQEKVELSINMEPTLRSSPNEKRLDSEFTF